MLEIVMNDMLKDVMKYTNNVIQVKCFMYINSNNQNYINHSISLSELKSFTGEFYPESKESESQLSQGSSNYLNVKI